MLLALLLSEALSWTDESPSYWISAYPVVPAPPTLIPDSRVKPPMEVCPDRA